MIVILPVFLFGLCKIRSKVCSWAVEISLFTVLIILFYYVMKSTREKEVFDFLSLKQLFFYLRGTCVFLRFTWGSEPKADPICPHMYFVNLLTINLWILTVEVFVDWRKILKYHQLFFLLITSKLWCIGEFLQ